ncbi:type IX secretion system motor protein PorL/GldL [Peijinzhouia sedimentorum]
MGAKKSGFSYRFYTNIMPKIYGIGAAVVLVGVLFKLTYLPGANLFLMVGLGTEAIIFFLSAFEPKSEDYDWSIVYPELADPNAAPSPKKSMPAGADKSVSRQLDQVLESAKVGPELIESLGTGLKSLSENVGNMSKLSNAVVATNEYAQNVKAASESMVHINQSYALASQSLEGFSNALKQMGEAGEQTQQFKTELGKLNESIASLNKVYGGMLSAMRS